MLSQLQYHHWLIILSVFFIIVERLFPWREQRLFRDGWLKDLCYLVFNGHYFAFILILLTNPVSQWVRAKLSLFGIADVESMMLIASLKPVAQFFVVLFIVDFVKWCVHNLLHRVNFLWEFHKIHHTIETLDWIGNMRFHWVEILVYKAFIYLPLAVLGANSSVLLTYYVVETFIGYLNHANLNVGLGALGYLVNNPRMHVWHHEFTKDGRMNLNFGIVLSLWDWLFGTAYIPSEQPERLGFYGMEKIPKSFIAQLVYPFAARRL